ncbi:MAG: hypothetical protein U1C53_02105 [Candidatus Veblenbacteria bacterium]|nr:hypothetical protein [Candidatus Veblenbacteria bacterium]
MDFSVAIYLAAISLSCLTGLFLLFEWLRLGMRHYFLFDWGAGLFLLYWYSMPWVAAGSGSRLVVEDLNWLFTFSFLLTFLGLLLITVGVTQLNPLPKQELAEKFMLLWYVAYVVFQLVYLAIPKAGEYLPLWVLVITFYIPLQLLLSYSLWWWFKTRSRLSTRPAVWGIHLLAVAAVTQLGITAAYLVRLLQYPAEFWFISLFNAPVILIFQAVTIILLISGGLLVRGDCYRSLTADQQV